MKNNLSPLALHAASGASTLTTCWRAVLRGGTVVCATLHDADIVFNGETYLAAAGFAATNIESSAELAADNLEVDGFLASPAITEADVYSGRWDYAAIEVFQVNYLDLGMGKNVLRTGTLGEVKAGRHHFTAELRGLMQAYSRTILRLTAKECDADLGDARCKVALGPITVAGTVAASSGDYLLQDAARTEAEDWFTGGKITFTSGLNNGLSMEVKRSAPGELELFEKMPFAIAVGDTYTVYAGCTKRFTEDCIGKHANGVNFRGFPHLPGVAIYKTGGVGA